MRARRERPFAEAGRYALRTDLPKTAAAEEILHDRYKDLARVEWAFRDSKTVQIEMRPVYLRDENRTRGHALVVMLASLCVIEVVIPRPARLHPGSDATRRHAPPVRGRRRRHPRRAAPRPRPRSHEANSHNDEKRNKVNPLLGARQAWNRGASVRVAAATNAA